MQIEEQSLEFQKEFCDLQCDISIKSRQEKEIDKILNESRYPRLRNFGLQIFSMFESTYLCECFSSKIKFMKTDKCSRLNDASLSALMRISLTTILVDILSLILCKRPRKSNYLFRKLVNSSLFAFN